MVEFLQRPEQKATNSASDEVENCQPSNAFWNLGRNVFQRRINVITVDWVLFHRIDKIDGKKTEYHRSKASSNKDEAIYICLFIWEVLIANSHRHHEGHSCRKSKTQRVEGNKS